MISTAGIFEKMFASRVIKEFLIKAHHQNNENFVHNIRLSLIPLKSLRMNGNNVGHWV